jgi:hypothetical protein
MLKDVDHLNLGQLRRNTELTIKPNNSVSLRGDEHLKLILMDLKVIDKELLETDNVRIISATLLIILSRRTDKTVVLKIGPDFMSSLTIRFHVKNPELMKNVYLMFVNTNDFRLKHEIPIQMNLEDLQKPISLTINSEDLQYLNNSYVFMAVKNY